MAITKVTSGLISADASSIDLNIDAGTLYLDVSENKVGIGTTSPSANLHVSGSGSQKIDVTDTGGVSTRLSVAGSNAFLGTTTNHDQLFITNDAERMRIDSSGNVGIGVSSVGRAPLHVHQATDNTDTNIHLTSNETGSTGSDGFTISVSGAGANDLDAYLIQRENANLRFYTNAIERMRINSSGAVGMSTTSLGTEATLHLGIPAGAGAAEGGQLILQSSANGSKALHMDNYNNASVDYLRFMRGTDTTSEAVLGAWDITNTSYLVGKGADVNTDAGVALRGDGGARFTAAGTSSFIQLAFFRNGSASEVGSITTTSSATAYNTSSDYRLKENVVEMTGALNRVNQLQPKRFNFIADETNTLVDGFIAHEVSDIVPEAVTGEKDGDRMQGIDQSKLVPLLTKAIQEQQTIIDNLTTRIETLENA